MSISICQSKAFIRRVTKEPIQFYIVLLINIIMVFSVKFFPCLDGPVHLNNSNILLDLLKGSNSLLSDYYSINSIIIPNWFSHFIIALFGLLVPIWLSEKFFIALYIFGLAFSFRLLIKQLSPQNAGLSILIFPFAYTHLFSIGFYNYSFSFVFLFLALYYWLKTQDKENFKRYIVLFLFITLTYFSGVLTYGFLGLILGFLIILRWIRKYSEDKNLKTNIIGALWEISKLLCISVPTLILLFLFYRLTYFPPPGDSYPFIELLNWLNNGRILIAYAAQTEEIFTTQLIHIILIIISLDFYQRYLTKKERADTLWVRPGDFFIVPILITLVLFLFIPDDSSARMMSYRYNVIFFMLLIAWVASSGIEKKINRVITLLIIVLHLTILFTHNKIIHSGIAAHATIINDAGKVMRPGSVVLPVNLSDNWIEYHFSSYLGTNRPLVILDNYEVEMGWFPVVYDKKSLPKFQLGQQNSVSGLRWFQNEQVSVYKVIDYVFIYGYLRAIEDPKWEELRKTLSNYYHLVEISKINYYLIYEKN